MNTGMFINEYDTVNLFGFGYAVSFTTVPWVTKTDFEMPVLSKNGQWWD